MPRRMADKPTEDYRSKTEHVNFRFPSGLLQKIDEYAARTGRSRSRVVYDACDYWLLKGPDVRAVLHAEPEKKKKKSSEVQLFREAQMPTYEGGLDSNPQYWPPALQQLAGYTPHAPGSGTFFDEHAGWQWHVHLLRTYGFPTPGSLRAYPSTKMPPPHPLPASLAECRLPPTEWTYTDHLDDEGNPITE